MLDRMRKSSQSVVVPAIFGLLIAIFIISFGPQSRGVTCEAATADDHYAAKVAGHQIARPRLVSGFNLVKLLPVVRRRQDRIWLLASAHHQAR